MSRIFNILVCIIKSKKIFSVEKKKFVIFDCVNSDILSKILPSDETYIISARVNLITRLLVNFETISFLLKNLFSRSMQLNYFISLIKQINPKFVITTIDNSINFSILTKYFEGKIKFIAIQNGTRGGIYENINDTNKILYYSNYMGLSDFDYELMKAKNIKVKNFFPVGSLTNSYFQKYIQKSKNNSNKNYDICFVSKRIFNKGEINSSKSAKDSFILLNFLSKYINKYNKNIIIQSKSAEYNSAENSFLEKLFFGASYKICWMDNVVKFNSYKNISSSKLVIGAPSTLLREASVYPHTKILCFNTEKEIKLPFAGLNILSEASYEKFEERLNLLLNLSYKDYLKKLDRSHNYLMHNTNTIDYFLEYLEKKKIN